MIGRHFDKNGDVMQWWSNETMNAFDEHTQCMIDQYSEYKFEEIDQYVNGRFTLEENMADDGGVKQAFKVNTYLKYFIKSYANRLHVRLPLNE